MKNKRINFLITDEKLQELDDLVERTGFKTRTELIENALALFEWAVREKSGGRIIASVDEEKESYKEIILPGLPEKADKSLAAQVREIFDRFPAREVLETITTYKGRANP